jgi:hypothetical protein
VLQGTWWVGSGPKFDPADATPEEGRALDSCSEEEDAAA